jgi:GT2 family glycosyltransferase
MFGARATYSRPPGVTAVTLAGRPGWATPQDGRIAGDDGLLAIWEAPESAPADPVGRAAVTCLAEAGLLVRDGHPLIAPVRPVPPAGTAGVSVSVVLVTYNSGEWIDACLASLRRQTHHALEVVVVDNGSPVDPVADVRRAHPEARYVRQPAGRSFASALNAGAAVATGSALLFLNPDVELEPDAIAQMVARLSTRPRVGAVAAKLRFHWAPAFLNGLGNRVEARSWGSDNAIGHLDLGQFDDRLLVPSACFAAALIPRDAWMAVGPVDEGYPMYYEDVAWCYRARRLGFDIVSAPDAVVYHAFGSRLASGDEPGLTPRKLAHVVYGRVRFASTALGGPTGRRFREAYLREDLANVRVMARRGDLAGVRAYARAWLRVAAHAWSWRSLVATLDDAPVTAEAVVEADARWPDGLTWNGVPELTLPIVRDVYLPLLAAGRTRPLPEWT